jgi:hypothetical protein
MYCITYTSLPVSCTKKLLAFHIFIIMVTPIPNLC